VHITEADGAVWVVDEFAYSVYRIDPGTNTATRVNIDLEVIDGTGFGDHPIAFGGGGLWVRESDASLARIDTASLTVAERVTTEPFGGGAFIATDDSLWYANLKGDSIVGLQRP
jgi:streptogramin lyase